MSALPKPPHPHRGILQPERPPLDAVQCNVCGCHWIPDPVTASCPSCDVLNRYAIYHQNDPMWPARSS